MGCGLRCLRLEACGSQTSFEKCECGCVGATLGACPVRPNLKGLKRQDVFDFEKLEVYQEMRGVNLKVLKHLFTHQSLDPYIQDQFKRASLSALLNLAEGTGRMTNPDKKKFYITARSSVFECVAILQIMYDTNLVEKSFYDDLYTNFEKVSRMLLGMIRSLE